MEILNKFGFEPELFIAQIVNFLILAYIFKRFLYKSVLKVLRDREKKIEQGLTDAEKAADALEKAQDQKDKIIKNAIIEAEKIITQTKESAEKVKQDMMEEAKSEAQKIMEDTREQIKIEMENVEKTARNAALTMSQQILEYITSSLFTKEDKNKIMKRGFEQMKKYDKQ